MKVLLLQTDIIWQESAKNRDNVLTLIGSKVDADIIILPEMFTTGFCTNPTQENIEKANTETLEWMHYVANKYDVAICGSLAVEEYSKYYNRFYFVKPDGSYHTYNKRHLFTYANEDKEYEAGEERIIVEYKGVKILLQICYDLRFPVFARNRGDYDMIVYVANWPTSRIEAWNTLLKARAIENLCYVAGINRVGEDPACLYSGGTAFINYMGQVNAAAQWNREEAIYGEIDLEALDKFRNKFPALRDADRFEIKL